MVTRMGGGSIPPAPLIFNRLTPKPYVSMRESRPTLAEIRRINKRRARMERITDALQEGCGWTFIVGFVTLMCGALFGASEFLATFSVGCMMLSVSTLMVWMVIDSFFNH